MKWIYILICVVLFCGCDRVDSVFSDEYEDEAIGYEVVEFLEDVECEVDLDCETPMRYLVQSHCPYDSICINERCNVICPKPFEGRAILAKEYPGFEN